MRTRLTLLHGGLFFVAGLALLGLTYLLFNEQLSQSTPQLQTARMDDGSGRAKMLVVVSAGDRLQGADAMRWLEVQESKLHSAATTSLLTQGTVALLAVGVTAADFGWLAAGRVLAPLYRVTETARRIAAAPIADRGLHERIALRRPDDEVKELADTSDTMVARLERSFDGQRRFVANASHELRTPLTLNRALVEMAMHRATASPDVMELGQALLEVNARQERLFSGLLLLARSEHEIQNPAPVDLADVVAHVMSQSSRYTEDAKVAVRQAAGPAPTCGDALLLERLVHNLVENAIKHNRPDGTGWVRVASRVRPASDDWVEVEVSNTGPTVPPYDVPGLFEPFRRLGADLVVTARSTGLGLSIVRSIVQAHGGDVTARPRAEGGLVVTATLPGARRAGAAFTGPRAARLLG